MLRRRRVDLKSAPAGLRVKWPPRLFLLDMASSNLYIERNDSEKMKTESLISKFNRNTTDLFYRLKQGDDLRLMLKAGEDSENDAQSQVLDLAVNSKLSFGSYAPPPQGPGK